MAYSSQKKTKQNQKKPKKRKEKEGPSATLKASMMQKLSSCFCLLINTQYCWGYWLSFLRKSSTLLKIPVHC